MVSCDQKPRGFSQDVQKSSCALMGFCSLVLLEINVQRFVYHPSSWQSYSILCSEASFPGRQRARSFLLFRELSSRPQHVFQPVRFCSDVPSRTDHCRGQGLWVSLRINGRNLAYVSGQKVGRADTCARACARVCAHIYTLVLFSTC